MDQASQIPPQGQAPQKSVGPIVGIVIIVIVLIVGALYFWGQRLNQEAPIPTPQPLSTSDSVEDLSADLQATALNGIDDSLQSIEAELNQ